MSLRSNGVLELIAIIIAIAGESLMSKNDFLSW